MGATTKIAWCDHTFNPWWGCTKVSAGCDNCYAETFDKRIGGAHWGPGAERRTMSVAYWNEPQKWDREAQKAGRHARVFCASMADVFDAEAPKLSRDLLWGLIRSTPNLDWLLLTKRPQLIRRYLPADWGDGYANVWLGTSVEDQQNADTRIPYLLAVPAAVRFLSCEPLLGPVDLTRWTEMMDVDERGKRFWWHNPDDSHPCDFSCRGFETSGLDWVIVGGESGPRARPMDLAWARSLVEQCKSAEIPVFVKQDSGPHSGMQGRIPDEMWIKQWPNS